MASSNFGPYASGSAYATALAVNKLGLQPNYSAAPSAMMTGATGGTNAQGTPKPGVKGTSTYSAPTGSNTYVTAPIVDQTFSGGGGGGGGGGYVPPSTYTDPGTGTTFGSYDQFVNETNRVYGELEGLVNQQEQSIRAGEQDLYTQATAPYDAQRPMLDQALAEGQQSVATAQQGVKKDEANAISEARRLYQELNQAGIQRFGGSSSAGEFANQILGREFQRNVGKAFDTAGQNMQKLVEKGIQIKQQYDSQLQSLEQNKQGALAQARDVFRQRLDQINNSRMAISENKAQLKLQALQQLRSEALAISQQYEQFRQQVYLQSMAADQNLKQAISSYRTTAMTPAAIDQQANANYSQYGTSGGTTTGGVYQGGFTTKKSPYDTFA